MSKKRIAIILVGMLGVVAAALILASVLQDRGGGAQAAPLAQGSEACCDVPAPGMCMDLLPSDCSNQGGAPQGAGTFCLGDGDGNGIDDACPGGVAPPPLVFPVIPAQYTKVSMPDFGQHSQNWCWVGAAANSFWWFAKTGDYPELVPAGYEYIEPESRNATGVDNTDPHDFNGDTITNQPDGVPDWFDYTDRPENTGAIYDGTCGDYIDNDGDAPPAGGGGVDFLGLVNPWPPIPPDPDCTSFASPLGDDDGDTLVDEDPINAGVDEDGDSTADEDPIDGIDNDGDYAPNPFGVCPGPGNPGCDEDPPAYDDDGSPGGMADEDGVVGYRTLLKKIAETMWHDTNEDGVQQIDGADGLPNTPDDEPNYVYSEPVEKWDYLCGLQKYIDDHGASLKVHDILDPDFRFRGITPDTDENQGASIKDRPGALPQPVQLACGVSQIVKTPTFTDYKRELSRSQDVLVWMCRMNDMSEWYCHVATGQAYDTTVAGLYGNGTLTVADPWSHDAVVHDDTWGQVSGPNHNNDWKHDQVPGDDPYDVCDVKTPGKDDNSEDFDIDCGGGVWTVVDLIFVSPPGPDIKVVDWTAPSPIEIDPIAGPITIPVQETKHNNGPMGAWSSVRWTAIVSDPTALNVRWQAQPGDACTEGGVPVDCATAPIIDDLEFEVDLTTVSVEVGPITRYLEIEALMPGNYTITLINEEWPIAGTGGPGTDPDPTNNDAVTIVYVNVPPPTGIVDKEVLDIVFDDADSYPFEGADIGNELTILKSQNVPFSVTSVDVNHGPDVPSDAEISFYAIVPDGCSGRWLDNGRALLPPDPDFPFDIQTIDGDITVGSSGTPFFPADKEPGPVTLDLHFQTAEYGLTEPLEQPQRYTRFFEIHCYGGQDYTFTFCNRADVKFDIDPVDNNLLCEDLLVHSLHNADKQVLDIRFDESNQYPLEGTELVPPNQYTIPVSETHLISVTSDDYNAGPQEVPDAEISFYAWVPTGCEGQFQDPVGAFPFDVYTVDGDYTVASSGTVVGTQNPVPGPGWVDLHFQTAEYGLTEPVGITQSYTRFFGLHCSSPGQFAFTFCNRADVKPPYVETNPGDEVLCEDLTVVAEAPPVTGACCDETTFVCTDGVEESACLPNTWYANQLCAEVPCPAVPPQVDLEKVDLYVKPFYCADSDMDGLEDGGVAGGAAPGAGNCCDGVDNDADTQTDGQDSDCWPYMNEDQVDGLDDDGDGLIDEDPLSWPSGQMCPWNGDDDCDSIVGPPFGFDEDPKNDLDDDPVPDGRIDEDPANGFLGIDNDNDGWVDEDGAGNFDWDGDTVIDEVQLEGVDDDGDGLVDEDPLDSPVGLPVPVPGGGPSAHEPHYLIKEALINWGPDDVWAVDTKEIDAPAWRADALEDGFTTCNDGLDNDGDLGCDFAPDACYPGSTLDPECNGDPLGEEQPGLHTCNDGLDNSTGFVIDPPAPGGDGLIDELDPDCQTLTEASVECKDPTDFVTVKTDVPYYYKPPSTDTILLTIPGCEQYYDDSGGTHFAKCVPCKIPMGVGPLNAFCGDLVAGTGYCIAVDSVPGVYKELDFHKDVYLPYNAPRNLHLDDPPGITDPAALGDPTWSDWRELYPNYNDMWYVMAWWDADDDSVLSVDDQLGMDLGAISGYPDYQFHVDDVTETVCLDDPALPGLEVMCIEPLGPTIANPYGPWQQKWPNYGEVCTVVQWDDTGGDGVVSFSDLILLDCPSLPPGYWLHVMDVAIDIWVTEKVLQEHQFDLSCEGEPGEHKFIVQNIISPQAPYADSNPLNNDLEMELLVECVSACAPGVDTDADTFNDDVECYVGTDQYDDCTNNPGVHDAWPLDNNIDADISFSFDVMAYAGNIGPCTPATCPRLDINADGDISFSFDVMLYSGRIGDVCV